MIQVRVREAAAEITRRREDGSLEGTRVGSWRIVYGAVLRRPVQGADVT